MMGDKNIDVKKYLDECFCLNVRRAARAVTRLYDDALNTMGLRSTQLNILMVLQHLEQVTVSVLADELVMDASTVARNLKPLEKQKLIVMKVGRDRRKRLISLTAKGLKTVEEGMKYWKEAQEKISSSVSKEDADIHLSSMSNLMKVARNAYDNEVKARQK